MINHSADFIKALTSPDRRYGEVPFYWWNGDPLDKDRLSEQLTLLSEKGIAGVQINYCHLNKGGENDLPYGGHGRSIPGTPEQFSDEWWEFFSYAAKECERLGMSIGMGDYTIAWIGNGYFTDKVASAPGMHAKNLSCEKKMLFMGDEEGFPEDTLCVITYRDSACEEPVIIYEKGKGALTPLKGMEECYIVSVRETENSIDPLSPECGKMLTEIYFKEFERRVPDVKPGTLNYFFQDELMFGCDIKTVWSDTLREGISEKYGYDILGFIPHLFYNLGDITPKIRLDTADVRTEITESSYFRPIFDFHNERGLIYGCDQSGRGKDPGEFSDYFRTVRWFTAPGNDTPGRAADLIKVKVNSSIAHLYNRPRVWLEGYHSSGWGTTLESITAPTSDNFIFGANLLNLHGLYYSTNGGFFEWAPPDFHFRMPYWDDEKTWLDKYKRLSAILTTGKHCCDAAIYYPVSSCDYGENAENCVKTTFDTAEYLFRNGLDFDFIDFQSIENAVCEDGRLKTSQEEYKVLIFAGVDAVRYSAIKKAEELLSCGGSVVFCGMTPYASDRKGMNDPVLKKDIEKILSHKNAILVSSEKEALSFINAKTERSFLPEDISEDEKVYVHARAHGDSRLFFVRYAKKDSTCRFEAEGIPYLLDTDTGKIIRLLGTAATENYTYIKMPLESDRDTVILFTYDTIDFDREMYISGYYEEEELGIIPLDGSWDFSLIPTLDNKYGDYYLPKGGIIGAEARFFDVSAVKNENTFPEEYEYTSLAYCSHEAMKQIICKENKDELLEHISNHPHILNGDSFSFDGCEYDCRSVILHDRYHIHAYDYSSSLFEQGHHGLKGRVYDDNISFTQDSIFAVYIHSENDCSASLSCGNIKPEKMLLNGKEAAEGAVELKRGKNLLLASFRYQKEHSPDYRNNGDIRRSSISITAYESEKHSYPLSVSSFANDAYYKLSSHSDEKQVFCFRFQSVPAFYGMKMSLFGELLGAYNNSVPMNIRYVGKGNFNSDIYEVNADNISPDVSEVVFFIKAEKGYEYCSLIPEPVKLFCGKGKLNLGDFTKTGALVSYSGKAVYEKDVFITKHSPDERFYIDIEDAAATLRVDVNGETAAVFTYHPFTKDITELIRSGSNHIKITVSNTLCNHYSTIPSKYSNFPQDSASGLFGPVNIRITENQVKEI